MSDLTDFRSFLDTTVKETPGQFTQTDKDRFIQEAVKQYSKDRPRKVVATLTGDGSTQTFDVPTDWSVGFSVVKEFEYPVDEVPRSVDYRLQDNLEVFQSVSGSDQIYKINLKVLTLASGTTARIMFTAPHTLVSGTATTIYAVDESAVGVLAAAHLTRGIAVYFAETKDASVAAEIVDHMSKAAVFDALADSLFKKYAEHISGGEVLKGALHHYDVDIRLPWGADLLFHKRRWR